MAIKVEFLLRGHLASFKQSFLVQRLRFQVFNHVLKLYLLEVFSEVRGLLATRIDVVNAFELLNRIVPNQRFGGRLGMQCLFVKTAPVEVTCFLLQRLLSFLRDGECTLPRLFLKDGSQSGLASVKGVFDECSWVVHRVHIVVCLIHN
jgi:hypothetical protein